MNENVAEKTDDLSDAGVVSSRVHRILAKEIARYGNQYPAAIALFNKSHDLFTQDNGPEKFMEAFEALNEDEQYFFGRLQLIENLGDQAAHRIARLGRLDDREHNPYHFETIVEIAKSAGKGRDYIEKVFDGVWIGDSGTPHPTGYLNEFSNYGMDKSGVDLLLDLIRAKTNSGFDHDVEETLRQMLDLDKDLAPRERSLTLGEILFAAEYALRHINARTQVLDDVQSDIDTVFGPKSFMKEPPNFSRRDLKMMITLLMWHAGDTDGKPNSEHWTLLASEVLTSYLSVSMHLRRLQEVDKILKNENGGEKPELDFQNIWNGANSGEKIRQELSGAYEAIAALRSDFYDIFKEVEQHYNELHDRSISADERAERYKKKEPAFDKLLKRMGQIYDKDNRTFFGRELPENRGLSFYDQVWREFKRLRDVSESKDWPPLVQSLLEDSAEDLRPDGFALFKIEPRHNAAVNRKTIDNLFQHEDFLNVLKQHKVLSRAQWAKLHKAGSLHNLDAGGKLEHKNEIYTAIEAWSKKNPGYLRKFLLSANPPGFDENGYPVQTYSLLRRNDVMAQYQLKFSEKTIIAESDTAGKRDQSFINSAFDDLSLKVPTPLTEDLENMTRTHDQLLETHEGGAWQNLQQRKRKSVPSQFIKACYTWMYARSDITRQYGPLSGILVYMQSQMNARVAAELGIPQYVMEGSGMSNERGGGDPMVMTRLVAQELQSWLKEAEPLLGKDMMDLTAKVVAQGKKEYLNPAQIAQNWKKAIAAWNKTHKAQAIPRHIKNFGAMLVEQKLKTAPDAHTKSDIKKLWVSSITEMQDNLKTMASTVLVTVQGRELYKTSAEIAREKKDQLAEMLGIRMELDGLVKPGTFIPQKDKFSPRMENFLTKTTRKMMERYSNIRDAKGEKSGQHVLNQLAFIASDHTVFPYTQNAARKPSKASGTGPKPLSEQRAIGNNIWIALMQTHHDGTFTAGEFLAEIHAGFHAGEISRRDLADVFMSSEHWDYNFFVRTLTPAARGDFAHGVQRLREAGIDVGSSHDELMNMAANTTVTVSEKSNGEREAIFSAGGADEIAAYFAMLYEDGFKLSALASAQADGSFLEEKDLQKILEQKKPQNAGLTYEFNKEALEKWPFLKETQKFAQRAKPALMVMHSLEKRLRNGEKISERLLRQASSAWRATTVLPNNHIYDYNAGYVEGRRKRPLPANVNEVLAVK